MLKAAWGSGGSQNVQLQIPPRGRIYFRGSDILGVLKAAWGSGGSQNVQLHVPPARTHILSGIRCNDLDKDDDGMDDM